jgi:hypothetical protein
VAVAATVAATAAATSCCDPAASAAPRGGSLAAAALSTALDALDECRLVGTNVPDLITLAGARSGTIGAALSTRRQEFELRPFKTQASEETTAYLKVEKAHFLVLEGSADAMVAADATTAALLDASAAHAGASATRTVPFVDRLVASTPAPAPGARSSAASAALGEGVQAPIFQRRPAPIALFFHLFPRRRVLRGRRRGESLLLAQPVFFVPLFPALPPLDPSLLLARHSLLLPLLRHARALRLGEWAGRTARCSRPPSAGKNEASESRRRIIEE